MTAPTPAPASALGPFIGAPHVRQAMLRTLAAWGPFYVAEAARQSGLDLPGFKDWINEPLLSPETTEMAPRYVVAVPQTIGQPEQQGNGLFRATWDCQIALWMWGGDYQDTQDRLGFYAIALREAVAQHQSLGGFAKRCFWRADKYAEVAATRVRTWGQAVVQFGVTVDNVMDVFAGPAEVPRDPTRPPAFPPAVTGAQITVQPDPREAR